MVLGFTNLIFPTQTSDQSKNDLLRTWTYGNLDTLYCRWLRVVKLISAPYPRSSSAHAFQGFPHDFQAPTITVLHLGNWKSWSVPYRINISPPTYLAEGLGKNNNYDFHPLDKTSESSTLMPPVRTFFLDNIQYSHSYILAACCGEIFVLCKSRAFQESFTAYHLSCPWVETFICNYLALLFGNLKRKHRNSAVWAFSLLKKASEYLIGKIWIVN